MMRAYDDKYLDDAMGNLAEAFDYAVNVCGLDIDEFMEIFIATGISSAFGLGSPKYIAGLSGIELVMEVITRAGKEMSFPEEESSYQRSAEYWCGWVIAYYQWYTAQSFMNIHKYISMKDVIRMYPTFHEANEDKFVDAINSMIKRVNPPTNLQTLRRLVGYSQKLLASKSGVSLRMIQQYEQRVKDINKASISNIKALSIVLGCSIDDLMEFDIGNIEE